MKKITHPFSFLTSGIGRGIFGLCLLPTLALGQGKLQQGFETSDTNQGDELRYSVTGGAFYSGQFQTHATGNNAAPKTENVAAEGTQSFGVINNTGGGSTTGVLTFEPTTFRSTSGNSLTFRVASFKTNNNGGLDNSTTGNGITVSIAYNGSSTFVETLRLQGDNNGSVYSFSATGTAPAVEVTNTSPTLASRTSPNDPTTGYTNIRINFGSAITGVQVRISLAANNKTALFVDDVALNSAAPLPVALADFSGVRQAGTVVLKWVTAQEKNNDRFEVQRSADGHAFEAIATVRGAGTSTHALSYVFTDARPLLGQGYYRLRQVDTDGTSSYSGIVAVAGTERTVLLAPNPAGSQLRVQLGGQPGQWRILTTSGQPVKTGQLTADATLDVSELRAGFYLFEVLRNGQRSVQKFSKL